MKNTNLLGAQTESEGAQAAEILINRQEEMFSICSCTVILRMPFKYYEVDWLYTYIRPFFHSITSSIVFLILKMILYCIVCSITLC